MLSSDIASLTKKGLIASLILYYAIVFLPILQSGFFSDDAVNSLNWTSFHLEHLGFWDAYRYYTGIWLVNKGRVYPLGMLTSFAVSYFFYKAVTYQIVHVFLISLNMLCCAWLLKVISKTWHASILFLFAAPLFWSIRNYHDPLTSFAGIIPFFALFMLLTLIFYIKSLENSSRLWTSLAVLTYICALLTYEPAMAVLPAILCLALPGCLSPGHYARRTWPYVFVTLAYLVFCMYLRHHTKSVYPGIQFGSISHFFLAFSQQFIAALPLSYSLLDHRTADVSRLVSLVSSSQPSIVLSAALLSLIIIVWIPYFIRRLCLSRIEMLYFLIIGASMTLVPSALIGISKHYQTELYWGNGYLPVYVQYIGACILFITALNTLSTMPSGRVKNLLICSVTGLCALISFCSLLANIATVEFVNNLWQNPRTLVETSLRHHLLENQIQPSDTIAAKDAAWNSRSFYQQNADILVNTIKITDPLRFSLSRGKVVYLLDYYYLRNTSDGFVILGRLTSVTHDHAGTFMVMQNPRIFLSIQQRNMSYLDIMEIVRAVQEYFLSPGLNVNLLETMNTQRDWTIINLPEGLYKIKYSRNSMLD